MFQQNSLGRIYVRGKPTPELTRARIIQLHVQGLSVSQISDDVTVKIQKVSHFRFCTLLRFTVLCSVFQ